MLRAGTADYRFAVLDFAVSHSLREFHVAKTASRPFDRRLWKAADQIHDRLKSADTFSKSLLDATYTERCWEESRRKLEIARNRRWWGALKELREEAWNVLGDLIGELETGRRMLDPDARQPVISSTQEIYRDCAALKDEFFEIKCDLRDQTLSVTTEPITLEETELGAFEIRLSYSSADRDLSYEVIAVDPNPSTKSDEITHPHVESNCLCAGDGRVAIKHALQQGRLLDFFLVVRQVLDSYNPSSAYAELDKWYGQSCPDCGAEACDDDLCTCEDCETRVCGDCSRYCAQCSVNLCGECCSHCENCQESTCRHCLTNCSACKTFICKGCLENDDDTICPECLKEKEEAASSPETAVGADGAVVHAVCVGQTAVPA